MSDFKIEKDIKMPVKNGNLMYPWDQMQVGDSFLLGLEHKISTASSSAAQYSKRHPEVKFSCRKTREGVRFWRIL